MVPPLVVPLENAPLALLLVNYPTVEGMAQRACEPLDSRKCLNINCRSLEEFGPPDPMSRLTRKSPTKFHSKKLDLKSLSIK